MDFHIDWLTIVSTHSRPKAAANNLRLEPRSLFVSTHSRPKAAANGDVIVLGGLAVSTHSRPKAAANAEAKRNRC